MKGTSNVNFYPTGNYVLVKMESSVSILGLATKKYNDEKAIPVLTIAGIGPKVVDLEIGDRVFIPMDKAFPTVYVPNNERDPETLHDYYRTLQTKQPLEFNKLLKDPSTNSVTVVLYGIFNEFQIQGVINA